MPAIPLDSPELSIDTITANSVALLWVKVPGASGYVIQQSADGESWTTIETFPNGDVESTSALGLLLNTSYLFRIQATGDGVVYSDSAWHTAEPVTTDKTTLTLADLTYTIPDDHVYTGTPQGIGMVTGKTGVGNVTAIYYDGSTTVPTNAGTYTLTVSVPDSAPNYTGRAVFPYCFGLAPANRRV